MSCPAQQIARASTDVAPQLSNASHFSNDLGLDSLDTVEVVMAIEEVRCFPFVKGEQLLSNIIGI